ncbi:hypothetical protein [Acinetobacter sp.]|uniref:hypothetical protein n=1 Tax=Acinetobacter sp. TaxID=472 RepID=UPI0035ADC70C
MMNCKNLCMAMLLFITASSFADQLNLELYLKNPATISGINSDSHIQNELAAVLGRDYIEFSKNFEDFAAPYKLKTAKAIYYEGRKKSSGAASAAALYADGRIYAAYYIPKNHAVRYFTNDQACSAVLHPTIQVFIKHYPDAEIEYAASNSSILKYNEGKGSACSNLKLSH